MRNVLVVEDDRQTRELLSAFLGSYGYQATVAVDGAAGLEAVARSVPDLVVLDLGLPDMSGLEVLRTLREWTTTPVLVLSGTCRRGSDAAALDAGADDYLRKPFAPQELAARLRAIDRRATSWTPAAAGGRRRCFDEVVVDMSSATLTVAGVEVRTTATEWRLLETVTRDPGRLLTHRYLISQVWDAGHGIEARGTLRAHVRSLRSKLGRTTSGGGYLRSENGIGYRWVVAPQTEHAAAPAEDRDSLRGLLDDLALALGSGGPEDEVRLADARDLAARAAALVRPDAAPVGSPSCP